MSGEITKSKSIILNYIKEQNIDLGKEKNIGELVNTLREVINDSLENNNNINEIKKFKTSDNQLFDALDEALKHEKLKTMVNEIIQLLGGEKEDICPDSCDFSNGEGYYILDKEKLKLAGELSIKLQEELGLDEYELTSRVCYENDYLGHISQKLSCITSLDDGTKIRVGQAYYANNLDKLGNKIYNPEILEEAKIKGAEDGQQIVDLMILDTLKSTLEALRETDDDNEIEELEINLTSICETILDGFDNGSTISEEKFNSIYKEFVKKDDFLEDEHVALLKNIKKSFGLPEKEIKITKEPLTFEKMKMKELIEELGNSIVSGEDTLIICEAIQNRIENGKGLKEENYESLKSFYKEFVKGNDDISSDDKKAIKEIKELFKEAIAEQSNDIDLN